MDLKPLKVTKLFCTKCDKTIGDGTPRKGEGRQKLLCALCAKKNRLKSGRKQDAKRREERTSQKFK